MFEGIRSYGGKVFRMEAHLDRLWNSAKAILLTIPMTKVEMAALHQGYARRQRHPRRLYPRHRHPRAGSLGLDPNHCSHPQVIIITDYISLYPEELYRNGLEIVTVSVGEHPAALSPRIKSLNYLNNILAKSRGSRPAASRP